MTEFKIDININQPPNIVDQALIEPGNAVQWTTDLERFEVVKGKPGEIGAIAQLHYYQKGRSYILGDVLEYSDPEKRYVSRVSGGGMNVRVETIINPAADGTEMTMSWSGTSDKFLIRMLLPFLRCIIIRRARADLEKFRCLVETHGVLFPNQ